MAFNETLAVRIRAVLATQAGVSERKMFGGLAFMHHGHMCCGVNGDVFMARVGPAQYAEALTLPHAREMDFTGRPLRGMVYVDSPGVADTITLSGWVERCLRFSRTLPPR